MFQNEEDDEYFQELGREFTATGNIDRHFRIVQIFKI
jgi:hypothetical protein